MRFLCVCVCLGVMCVASACGGSDPTNQGERWSLFDEGESMADVPSFVQDEPDMASDDVVDLGVMDEPDDVVEPGVIDEPEDMDEPDDVVEPEDMRSSDVSNCDLQRVWWQGSFNHQYGSDLIWSPDMSAVANVTSIVYQGFSWAMLDPRTGDVSFNFNAENRGLALDESWQKFSMGVRGHDGQTTDRVTGEEIHTFSSHGTRWKMSRDGRRLLHLRREADVYLDVWDLESGEIIFQKVFNQIETSDHSLHSYLFDLSDDGSRIAFASPVTVLDMESSEEFKIVSYREAQDGSYTSHVPDLDGSTLVELEFSPGQQPRLHMIDERGLLTMLDDRYELVGDAPRGVFEVSSRVDPILASPVAWSGDAQIQASVNTNGEVEVNSMVDSAFNVLDPPDYFPEEERLRGAFNAPVSIGISPDKQQVMVAYRQGLGMWSCNPVTYESQPNPISTLSLELPIQVNVRQTYTIPVRFDDSSEGYSTLARIYHNGNSVPFEVYDVSDHKIELYFHDRKTYEFEIEVFNVHGSLSSGTIRVDAQ